MHDDVGAVVAEVPRLAAECMHVVGGVRVRLPGWVVYCFLFFYIFFGWKGRERTSISFVLSFASSRLTRRITSCGQLQAAEVFAASSNHR